jgi:hypothetical protein
MLDGGITIQEICIKPIYIFTKARLAQILILCGLLAAGFGCIT